MCLDFGLLPAEYLIRWMDLGEPTLGVPQQSMFVSKKIAVLVVVGVLLSAGGIWTYKLAWGRPLNINHFYERVQFEVAVVGAISCSP